MSVNIISSGKKSVLAVFESQLGLPPRANLQTVCFMRTVLRRHGVTCSRLLSLKIKRAAEFWPRCSGATVTWGRPASAALQ